jgi:hypothetical protein
MARFLPRMDAMLDLEDEIALELARLQRAAFERARKRAAEQQLGEAWIDLEEPSEKAA